MIRPTDMQRHILSFSIVDGICEPAHSLIFSAGSRDNYVSVPPQGRIMMPSVTQAARLDVGV